MWCLLYKFCQNSRAVKVFCEHRFEILMTCDKAQFMFVKRLMTSSCAMNPRPPPPSALCLREPPSLHPHLSTYPHERFPPSTSPHHPCMPCNSCEIIAASTVISALSASFDLVAVHVDEALTSLGCVIVHGFENRIVARTLFVCCFVDLVVFSWWFCSVQIYLEKGWKKYGFKKNRGSRKTTK